MQAYAPAGSRHHEPSILRLGRGGAAAAGGGRHRHATCGLARSAPPSMTEIAPRALLIDEIDKSDIDLPNDLLHVFEEGDFEIPELVANRQAAAPGQGTALRRQG